MPSFRLAKPVPRTDLTEGRIEPVSQIDWDAGTVTGFFGHHAPDFAPKDSHGFTVTLPDDERQHFFELVVKLAAAGDQVPAPVLDEKGSLPPLPAKTVSGPVGG